MDEGNAGREVSNAWLVTFSDLLALMLTFFVLVFSMSEVRLDALQPVGQLCAHLVQRGLRLLRRL